MMAFCESLDIHGKPLQLLHVFISQFWPCNGLLQLNIGHVWVLQEA